MALSKEETVSIVKKFGKNDKDTGSAEVQIALLSQRIADLTR
jgi:small subunit ribosomal protein S15